ncbi:MAG: hypothetical protein AB8G18_13430 [Gammaproteobacteria bacterium]
MLKQAAKTFESVAYACHRALGSRSLSSQVKNALEHSSVAGFEGVSVIVEQLTIADARDTGVLAHVLGHSNPSLESGSSLANSFEESQLAEQIETATNFSDGIVAATVTESQRRRQKNHKLQAIDQSILTNRPGVNGRQEFGRQVGNQLAETLSRDSNSGSVLTALYRLAEQQPLLHHALMKLVWARGAFPGLMTRGLAVATPTAVEPEPASPAVAEDKPTIVSIQIIDADTDDKFVTGTAEQYVNLNKDKKWIDGIRIKQKDRCSQKLRFKVVFDKPGSHAFKVVMKTKGSNVKYSATEKSRNSNFKYQDKEKSYSCSGDGTKIVADDFFVTAAGNDQFWLEATDGQKNTVKSAKIETKRLIYCVELKMKGLKTIAASTATMVSEYDSHGVVVEMLPSTEMKHLANISNTDTATYKKEAKTAYAASTAKDKQPYVVALGYTDHLAVKDANQIIVKTGVKVGPGKPKVRLFIKDSKAKTKYLWNDLVPKESWYVSATFLKAGGIVGTDEVDIPLTQCTAVARSSSVKSALNKVDIDVTKIPAGTGSITLKVNWVNRMRAGLSFGGGNLICVCTRAWWRDISESDQNDVIVHELGHKIGMVPEGKGKGPDKTATQYTGKGHVGSHCYTGAGVLTSYSGAAGTCVMFGSTNGSSAFCGTCTPAVKKVDISSGWKAF